MYTVYLKKSNIKNKKYSADLYIDNKRVKRVNFGDSRYEDYTTHKNDKRKNLYIQRHRNDNLKDPKFAGFWSMHLLWNKKTINESIKDIENRFNIKINLQS